MRYAWLALLFAGVSVAHAEVPRVAVIEAFVPPDTPAARSMDWTDAVRGALQRCLGASHLVMTRQNIESLLPPGVDLAQCEGDCEVETGRNVGADLVTSVRVTPKVVALLIRRTVDGEIVARGHAPRGDDVSASLVTATDAACAPLRPEPATNRRLLRLKAEVSSTVQPRYLRIESPHGATVEAFGRAYTTPVTIQLPLRYDPEATVRLFVEATGYPPADVDVTYVPWTGAKVVIDLGASEGRLSLGALPVDAEVQVDRSPPSRARALRLSAGVHTMRIRHPCFDDTPLTVTVAPGERVQPDLAARVRCGHALLTSTTPGATAVIDGGARVQLPTILLAGGDGANAVRVEAPDHFAVERTIDIPQTGRKSVQINLERREAKVEVVAQDVFGRLCTEPLRIDGALVGRGRWRGRLSEGKHRFDSGCGVDRKVHVSLRDRRFELIHDAVHVGLGLRSEPGRTVQGVVMTQLRTPTAPHIRLQVGATLGGLYVGDQSAIIAGIDLGLGVPLTPWLDLTARSTFGDGQRCTTTDDRTAEECDAEFLALAGGVRLAWGWVAADIELAGVFEDVSAQDGRWHVGPSATLWLTIPRGRVERRNK